MRKLIYWLMGDETGRRLVGGWNWWWGTSIIAFHRPKAAIAQLSIAVAEESLRSMQDNVRALEKAVSQQTTTCTAVKQKYKQKLGELSHQKTGDRTISNPQVEQFLEQLKHQVERAEMLLWVATEKLKHEQEKLQSHQVDMQLINDLMEIEQSVAGMVRTNRQLRVDTADAQFTAAKSSFHEQIERLQAEVDVDANNVILALED